MKVYEKIAEGKEKIALVGLGYVGLPIAFAFSQRAKVIGFDINQEKISLYKNGKDPTGEVGNERLRDNSIEFTSQAEHLKEAIFCIVAVPTPIRSDKTPNLEPICNASRILGRNLKRGAIVVYESTVYPGVTEEICIPILEQESGLCCGRDFKVGYSPERINPGDQSHRLHNIVKIVSGIDEESLNEIAKVYELVIEAGIHRAQSIKIAEAAKVIENSQRDINIAFMNELSIIFHEMGIDTKAVLEAAGTKWNFLKFTPGIVGGHCIGVDPYYLTYKAELLGYRSKVILAGRQINDDMGKYIAKNLIKTLIQQDISVKNAKIAILGITFKENCPDVRNTKVVDIYQELQLYGIAAKVVDPIANAEEVYREYGIRLSDKSELKNLDAVILAVAHTEYKSMQLTDIMKLFSKSVKSNILFDIKGIYGNDAFKLENCIYWRL